MSKMNDPAGDGIDWETEYTAGPSVTSDSPDQPFLSPAGSFINVPALVARLKRRGWKQIARGADGLGCWDQGPRRLRFIRSVALEGDGQVWEHFSLSRRDGQMPPWEQVRDVFALRRTLPDFTHGTGSI